MGAPPSYPGPALSTDVAIRALLSTRPLRPHHVPTLGAGADTVLCHTTGRVLLGGPCLLLFVSEDEPGGSY